MRSERDRGGAVGHLDDEADRPETLFHVALFVGCVAAQQNRVRTSAFGNSGCSSFFEGSTMWPYSPASAMRQGSLGLDRAEYRGGDVDVAQEPVDRRAGSAPLRRNSCDPDRCRCRRRELRMAWVVVPHLTGVQAQRKGEVAKHCLVLVGGLDHHVVHRPVRHTRWPGGRCRAATCRTRCCR